MHLSFPGLAGGINVGAPVYIIRLLRTDCSLFDKLGLALLRKKTCAVLIYMILYTIVIGYCKV